MSDGQLAILALERKHFRLAGEKDAAIRALGLTPTRYFVGLNLILDHPAALRVDPVPVNKLRRLRAGPQRAA